MKDKLKIDGHKLDHHPERIASWKKGENIYPIYVEIGISSICNHRCIFCALDYMKYKGKILDTNIILNTLTDMGKTGVKSVMFGGEGEPTLHKDFTLIVESAKKSGLDVAITTNGILFNKKMAELCLPHISWIKFSIDAGTKETYATIHKTNPDDFDKLITNIKNTVMIKKKRNYPVKIGTQLLLINENISEVITLAKKVKELGVDYFVIKPYSQHPDSANKFKTDYGKFKSLKDELGKLNSEKFEVIFRLETMNKLKIDRSYKICYGLPFFCLIDSQGNIIPCNLFYGREDYYYGNLYKITFLEIWNSEKRKKVLERFHREGTINCRENCRLDSINRHLHSLKNPPEHVNFI